MESQLAFEPEPVPAPALPVAEAAEAELVEATLPFPTTGTVLLLHLLGLPELDFAPEPALPDPDLEDDVPDCELADPD